MKVFDFRKTATIWTLLLLGASGGYPLGALTYAATYHVSANGDDSNPGTEVTPWKTVQKAAAVLQPGDTVLIHDGTYSGTVRPAVSGTSNAWITYKAYPGHHPVLTSSENITFHIAGKSYIEVNGLTITGTHPYGTGIEPDGPAHHIRILSNIVRDNGESGIGTGAGADYLFIEGNTIHGNCRTSPVWQGSGISLWQLGWYDNAPGVHNVIQRNRIYDNRLDAAGTHTDANGIIIDVSGNNPPVRIENNVIFNNGGRCINIFKSGNTTISSNTCYMNNADPAVNDGEIFANQSVNVTAYNNLVYSRSGIPTTASYNSSQLSFDYNLSFNGPVNERGPHDIVIDPKLVNPAIDPGTADVRLREDSPAVDRGTPSGAPGIDFEGNPRPVGEGFDIGAYEYNGANPTSRRPDSPRNLQVTFP